MRYEREPTAVDVPSSKQVVVTDRLSFTYVYGFHVNQRRQIELTWSKRHSRHVVRATMLTLLRRVCTWTNDPVPNRTCRLYTADGAPAIASWDKSLVSKRLDNQTLYRTAALAEYWSTTHWTSTEWISVLPSVIRRVIACFLDVPACACRLSYASADSIYSAVCTIHPPALVSVSLPDPVVILDWLRLKWVQHPLRVDTEDLHNILVNCSIEEQEELYRRLEPLRLADAKLARKRITREFSLCSARADRRAQIRSQEEQENKRPSSRCAKVPFCPYNHPKRERHGRYGHEGDRIRERNLAITLRHLRSQQYPVMPRNTIPHYKTAAQLPFRFAHHRK